MSDRMKSGSCTVPVGIGSVYEEPPNAKEPEGKAEPPASPKNAPSRFIRFEADNIEFDPAKRAYLIGGHWLDVRTIDERGLYSPEAALHYVKSCELETKGNEP